MQKIKKVGLLTDSNNPRLSSDDQYLLPELKKQGISFEIINWNTTPVKEMTCSHVFVRSPWDYYLKIENFLDYLEQIEDRGIQLLNSRSLIEWNCKKDYLLDLKSWNLPIVDSYLFENHENKESTLRKLRSTISEQKLNKFVIKPTISGSSFNTFLLNEMSPDINEKAMTILKTHNVLLQPYIESISTQGEVSLIYYSNGKQAQFSHAVLKKPKTKDFRVQAEFGGHTEAVIPPQKLKDLSEAIFQHIEQPWLYARIDLVDWQNSPLISEVEMIEPALYLSYNAFAAHHCVANLVGHL